VQDAAVDGNVIAFTLVTTVTVTVPVTDPNEPARVLAETLRLHVPNGRLATETPYVTLVPGLFAPVTEISVDEISVPLAHACTEVAFKSPPADVTFRVATFELAATVGAVSVGAAWSTKTVNGALTVVIGVASLSVALKVTVFRPALSMMGIDHDTPCNAGVATCCHCDEPTLYPMLAMSVVKDPALALAIPLNVTRVLFA